jgi:DNA-binding PadR family transcriptional regulator
MAQVINLELIVLQALSWGKMSCPVIAEWINNGCNGLIILSIDEIKRSVKRLEKQGLVEHRGQIKDPHRTGLPTKVYAITDRGRISLMASREVLKFIFARPPAHLQIHLENVKRIPAKTSQDNQ